MADLLRSGHKMLNMACPICNNPIFKKRSGETFCPTCNRKVLIVKNKSHQKNAKIESRIQKNNNEDTKVFKEKNEVLLFLKEVIIEKIDYFSKKLKSETQIDLIERYINILLNFYEILFKYSNLDI
ncbi:MAG: Sjogren's syndrome/scleroderma autoantigen 1 family protein [Promethearchaeota archaeon]